MTFERKIIVGLEDITAMSFQCLKCPFKITVSPDNVGEIPTKCSAGHDWFLGEKIGEVLSPVETFMKSVGRLRMTFNQKALGFKVLLEFDEPKEGK